MSCSECRGYNVSVCPCCNRGAEFVDNPDFFNALELFAEIREGVILGKIMHRDEIEGKIQQFTKNMTEQDKDGFADFAWDGELEEFKNLGDHLESVEVCAECGCEDMETVSSGDEGWTICEDCRTVEGDWESVYLPINR